MSQLSSTAVAVLLATLAAVLFIWRETLRRNEQKHLQLQRRREAEQQENALRELSVAVEATARSVRENALALGERQDRLRDAMDARIDAMQSSNERKLEQMRQTVDEQLRGNLNESFQTVNRQLADVNRGLGRMNAMVDALGDMKKVLGGVKTRGVWGEVRLRTLLEDLLATGQYVENCAIPEGSANRVEFAVRMPNAESEALLPIDAKLPQEDYLRLVEASERGDAAQLAQCGAAFERALTEQAKRISEKYIRPPMTTDFAVMFLPVESLYAEAVRRPGLCEKLQTRYRILVAGPNTLAALLTNLRTSYTTVKLRRQSGEILNALIEARETFGQLQGCIDTVRKRLAQTDEALEALDVKTRKMKKLLDRFGKEEP